jgi:hypothetical protein
MVKRQRIASRPNTPPPEADQWVSEKLDPEIKSPIVPVSATPEPSPAPTAPTKEKGKAFPHRISFDTDADQYRRLKRAGFESDRALTDIAREAVEDWLKARDY